MFSASRSNETFWWAYSRDVQARLRDAIARARNGETVRYDVPVRVAGGTLHHHRFSDWRRCATTRGGSSTWCRRPSTSPSARRPRRRSRRASRCFARPSSRRPSAWPTSASMAGGCASTIACAKSSAIPARRFSRKTFQDITHPDDVDTDVENAARLMAGEIDSYAMEKRYLRPDGSVTWVNLTVSLRRTPSGEPEHFISVVEDISARKRAEERLAVVASELNHRVKNTLATIQSVIAHGAREPMPKDEFVRSVIERIQAMASAHDLLVRSQWQGAALSDLLSEELRPHGLDRIRPGRAGPLADPERGPGVLPDDPRTGDQRRQVRGAVERRGPGFHPLESGGYGRRADAHVLLDGTGRPAGVAALAPWLWIRDHRAIRRRADGWNRRPPLRSRRRPCVLAVRRWPKSPLRRRRRRIESRRRGGPSVRRRRRFPVRSGSLWSRTRR